MSFALPNSLSCTMASRRFRPSPDTIDCDVSPLTADVGAVDVLARLQVVARRAGMEIRVRDASPELLELLDFVGLRETLCVEIELRVEVEGQAEEREQRLGVEEERELDDPAL
jgi:STAS domain